MDIQEHALAYLDDTALVQLTRDLVRICSINPPGDEAAVATHLAERFARTGIFTEVVPHDEAGRASVVGALRGSGERPALLLSGHLDTVPAGDNWQHDILAAEISDGKIWGLGTTDMKSGVAAMVVAMEAIRQAGVPLKGDLLFAGTAGEEVDSMGAQRLVQQQKLSEVGFMVIGEPTTNRVFTAEKGVLWLELNTRGQTAHGSMPHLGVNAIMHMNTLLQALAAANIPYEKHPLLGDFTMNVATITGGVKTNVVPDACRVTIDTRTVMGQDHQQILDTVRQLIDQLCAADPTFQAEVHTITERVPLDIPFDAPAVQTFVRVRDHVTGQTSVPTAATYATDGSIFVPAYQAPMVICGPGLPEKAHQPNEYVDIARLTEAARIYTMAALELLT
ncbi:MAG: M20 family metallopeptidase [Candidatus Tectomicrobia bacterium]|uniref:Probable succinyl-diaminopimelate desuccinylase n=1 Tax=Tectimicrobiota bacterium TaxID=2528274 RepID=A0A937W213_UNCTE|nr:M20 family metallopeptidase [Candidatus Tectomicrobia bacterium]